jgi:hypothetical protein
MWLDDNEELDPDSEEGRAIMMQALITAEAEEGRTSRHQSPMAVVNYSTSDVPADAQKGRTIAVNGGTMGQEVKKRGK